MIIILITTIITILIITTAILVLTLITRRAVVLSWVAVLCRDMPFAGLQIAFFDVYKGLFAGLEDAGVRARSPPLPPPPSSHCRIAYTRLLLPSRLPLFLCIAFN